MPKDALGHGSNPRGVLDPHREARRAIQLAPNSPNPQAEAVLRGYGYGPNDIMALRARAGMAIAEGPPAAHQAGVQRAVPKDMTRVMIDKKKLKKVAGV